MGVGQKGHFPSLFCPAIARAPHSGRIAQLVEQLTLNQRVVGSSPTAPTSKPKKLNDFRFEFNMSRNTFHAFRRVPVMSVWLW